MPTATENVHTGTEIAPDPTAQRVFTAISEKLGKHRFNLWFGQETQCKTLDEANAAAKVLFLVRNNFAITSIRRYCQTEIEQAVLEVFGERLPIDFAVKPVPKPETKKTAVVPSIPKPIQDTSPLGALFHKQQALPKSGRHFASMSDFIEGESNRLACKAADLAINHPGGINPIYIFGPTSIGKTHLLEGIWATVRKQHSRRPPLYLTAEQFVSSFLDTFRSGTSREGSQHFRGKFKGISHLLIDDIQFFAKKEATQAEFLQIIDSLKSQGVQLVFTGDRPLNDLPLRSDVLSRLESGMICGIDLPERELSLKICERMVKQRELPIDIDVCRLIASRFGVHGRQISGAVNRLHMVYLTNGKPMTAAVAEEVLNDLLRLNRRDVRLHDISKAVCEEFGISETTLRSKSRVKQIAAPRMLAMWLARKYTRSALSEIGQFFGNHSHSSVIAAQRKMDQQIGKDTPLAAALQKLEHVLG
jgi:chromosomal replication initiator protein